MNKTIIKLCVLALTLTLALCSCSKTGSTSDADKPEQTDDTFVRSEISQLSDKIESYNNYKQKAQQAFGDLTSTPAEDFSYSNVDGGIKIDGYNGKSEMIIIPSEIDGKSVTEIASEAFYTDGDDSRVALRSVYVPDSVKKIGKGAFKKCSELQLLRVPFVGDGESVTHAGYIFGAEKYDENAVNLPVSLEMMIIGDGEDSISDYAFYGMKSLDAVVITGVRKIGKFAFYECEDLCFINFSEKLESIGEYAFSSCTALAKTELPYSLKSIGFGAFYLCKNMTEMTLPFVGDGESATHIGYIFGAENADWNENFVPNSLLHIILSENCKRIENKAFANCKYISKVTFSDGLEYIGIRSFVNCRSVVELNIPSTVKKIDDDAFFGCDGLDKLYITGSTETGRQSFANCGYIAGVYIATDVRTDITTFYNTQYNLMENKQ